MSQPPSEPYPGERRPEPPTSGLPSSGLPSSGLPSSGLPSSGLPSSGLPQPGWSRPDETAVFPAQGASGFPPTSQPQPGYPQPGYPPDGYPQPGYAQPGYPQDGYAQPSYAQPGYAQPGYAQPGYPQDGYPQPGYPGAPGAFAPGPSAPRKRSKLLPIVLSAVAVLLVLCVGGIVAVLAVIGKKDVDSDPVAAPPTARTSDRPAPPTPRRTVAPPPDTEVRLVAPTRLGGRPRLTDPQFAVAAKTLQDSLKRAPGATSSIGALYGDPAKRNIVIVAAVAAPVPSPDQELSATMLGAGASGTKLTGIVTVDPGPLGGTAQCGNSTTSGVKLAMCVWADNGSVGWFIWYFRSVKQVTKEFPKLRAQVETTR